jgi:hypothetical protein
VPVGWSVARSERFLGIDPGKKGATALLCFDANEIHLFADLLPHDKLDQIDVVALGQVLKRFLSRSFPAFPMIWIEMIHTFSPRGFHGTTQKNYIAMGAGFGRISTVLDLMRLKYETRSAVSWQSKVFKELKAESNVKKERSFEAVARVFPIGSFRATRQSRKPHDGLVDATLIALAAAIESGSLVPPAELKPNKTKLKGNRKWI